MNNQPIDKAEGLLPFAWVKENGVLLTEESNGTACFLCCTGFRPQALMEARRNAPAVARLTVVNSELFEQALLTTYQQNSLQARQMMENLGNEVDFFSLAEELPKEGDLLDSDDDAPIIRLINAMLSEAIKEGASDIHIEPFERKLVIRFRVDGILRKILEPQRKLAPLLVSRIKVMAKLDIAEKRIPQDGRIALRIGGRSIDVRVSTIPSSYGERVVMRVLDKNSVRLDLSLLGMSEQNQQQLEHLIHQPHGIILVTGPTGSGKSTTLYAALSRINSSDRNIMTVEDPIEYELEGIGQTQVNTKVNMTFARGLRAILRQDPDVVLIGEIRDKETAEISTQASLTGHLVLSTLHTNTAIGAITRLQDMGIETFLIASSLLGILAQRLVRTLCIECRQPRYFDQEELAQLKLYHLKELSGYQAVGCEHCNFTGYRGRTGLHELVVLNDTIRLAMQHGKGEAEIIQLLGKQHEGIRVDGINKVSAGITTLEEVLRATGAE